MKRSVINGIQQAIVLQSLDSKILIKYVRPTESGWVQLTRDTNWSIEDDLFYMNRGTLQINMALVVIPMFLLNAHRTSSICTARPAHGYTGLTRLEVSDLDSQKARFLSSSGSTVN